MKSSNEEFEQVEKLHSVLLVILSSPRLKHMYNCVTPRSMAKASTRKMATTEFGGEAVLFPTLFLRSSDWVSLKNVKTRNISRTSKHRAALRREP